jgi:HPt (histidine-containing phosphotransfer) domain-containing protein
MMYELSRLEAIAEGDQEFMIKVLKVFVIEVTEDLIRMRVAFQQNNLLELSKLAHKIKPSLVLIGIEGASESCLQIEKNKLDPIPLELLNFHLVQVETAVMEVVLALQLDYKLS